jgi:uncharacterized protein (TIGR00375 family)
MSSFVKEAVQNLEINAGEKIKPVELNDRDIIADLHIHSRYSRATSKNLSIENLVKWARIKGLNLLGTGDISHELWLKEIKEKLKEDKERGILWFEDDKGKFPFILTGEISLVFTSQGKGRRVHLVYFAPNFEANEKINKYLDTKGRRDYDGRPIFSISCEEFVRQMMLIDSRIEVIPAHCLLGDELIHTENATKKIKEIKIGEKVFTHEGRLREVKEVLVNDYKGEIFHIKPWYFLEGLKTTPEHPFFIVKSYKNCPSTKGTCKPLCCNSKWCKNKKYLDYRPAWICAKDLEKSDFLVYPRPKNIVDIKQIDIRDYIQDFKQISEDFIISKQGRNHVGKTKIKIDCDERFCRLIGYFLSEGYLTNSKAIAFSFNAKETDYMQDVISIVKDYFGIELSKLDNRSKQGATLIFYSKILNSFFNQFYYRDVKRASSKFLPDNFLNLPREKLAEILRGWWRGDTGVTVSRQLADKMKSLCLKIGIIPSIKVYSVEYYTKKSKKFIGDREIIPKNDAIIFSNLSFFEEDFGMLKEPCFKKSINKLNRKHGWIDENYAYLPIREIHKEKYSGEVYNLEVEEDNSYTTEFACVHNCMTPWFGVFGSESGFNSLKDAFESQYENVHAVESGMSADPEMLWKLKFLEDKAIVSFSDSHSFWPWRLGREATIFHLAEGEELSYNFIINQIINKTYKSTIETDPCYGKYHYDGHRLCNFSCSPQKTKELNGICPVCKKELVIGVENRVEELTNNKNIPKNAKPFFKLLPLHELIAFYLKSKPESKKTWSIYNKLIEKFGNEFNILLKVDRNVLFVELTQDKLEGLAQLIIDNRIANLFVQPGYDGVYGILVEKNSIGKSPLHFEDNHLKQLKCGSLQKTLIQF